MFELDHVFIWCEPGAPETRVLERAGLRVGRRRRHPGQGTANACYFFGDAMLELIWIDDEVEAQSPSGQRLSLLERARWRRTGACPVGVALRGDGPPPFPTWAYTASFLPPDTTLAMAENSTAIAEPLLFCVPLRSTPGDAEHPLVELDVTRAVVTVPRFAEGSLLRDLPLRNVHFTSGKTHLLEIELGAGAAGSVLDCRPELPLVLRW